MNFHYQSGYHKFSYAMAMTFYLRCLIKGYSFTDDSSLTDTVIENLSQDLH